MNERAGVSVAALTTQEQFREAVRLQKEIWKFEDIELLPARLFTVAVKVGGQAFGAFDEKRMVAFALAIPGIKRDFGVYLHSHMVGVSERYRNRGLGRMLKLAQRAEALSRGIGLMEWTFDPLEIKNAYFNIQRLGAIVRRHVYNQYGETSSVLHGGMPTDRITAEWWLDSHRVRTALQGELPAPASIRARVHVPAEIVELRSSNPAGAREVQSRISEDFSKLLDGSVAVVGFESTPAGGDYLLGEWTDEAR